MSTPRTRRRWLELLRRTTGTTTTVSPTAALDDAALWEARERSAKASGEAEKLGERVVASAARHRTNVEAALERANQAIGRREVLVTDLRHVQESVERLGVVGLNAGLEGARSAEPMGRGLLLVSEEIRAHVGRAADSARELGAHLDELTEVVADLAHRMERVQREAQELATDSSQLKSAVQDSLAGLADLETLLRKATGIDPQTAKYVVQVGEHTKGLLGALNALEGVGARQAAAALVPLLSPLLKVISGIVSDDGPPDSSRESS